MTTTATTTIKAVLFDFDGTLSQPGAINFADIRRAIGCPPEIPILEFIERISDFPKRQKAITILDQFESEAAADTKLDPSAAEVITQLRRQHIRLGIISRNSRRSILRAFENFDEIELSDFDQLITRDDPIKPKPSGDGIKAAAKQWRIDPKDLLVVGDFIFDTQAGQRAGSPTVLIDRNGDPRLADIECDFRIRDLKELIRIVQLSQPLTAGKLPNEMLADFLHQFEFDDPSVLVSAGIGDDTAAVDVLQEEVVVLKSDPITFATEAISQYAVLVNANDIATAGAIPRWFLTTLLFPPQTTAMAIRQVMKDLFSICNSWGITLCGGHTEITDAVNRPVVVGMMAGTVRRKALIEKKNMRPGNKILLTKSVAVEGTAIIAREFSEKLMELGLTAEEIQNGKECLSQISILPEARLASQSHAATAMHDVTEGGLATAVEELSISGGHRLTINMDAIPYCKLTRKLGKLMGFDPLGLIGSGSLLICCKENNCAEIIDKLHREGIAATCIGEVGLKGQGVDAYYHGKKKGWPRFKVDEIVHLFD